jgi:hypothetical protein
MKMVPTEVTETSTLSIHTPGNYPKEENTRYSQHGESLKAKRVIVVMSSIFRREYHWRVSCISLITSQIRVMGGRS